MNLKRYDGSNIQPRLRHMIDGYDDVKIGFVLK